MKRLLLPLLAALALPTAAIEQPLLFERKSNITTATEILATTEMALVKSAAFYYNRGIDKYDSGDYQGAISDFNRVINQYPNHPKINEAYYNRGLAKRNLGDNYGAIADYSKAIEINPRYSGAYNNRAKTKYMLGDMKGSCTDAKKAASLGNEESKRILRGSIGAEICGSSRN